MAINTRKISDWLSANGQAVTNASLNTMKPYLEKNMAQMYDGVFIMYHRAMMDIRSWLLQHSGQAWKLAEK